MVFIFAALAFASILLGGLFALKFKDKLHLILGFSAGAVVGVAIFELLPEAIELSKGYIDTHTTTLLIALGFIVFMILDRTIFLHGHCEDENCASKERKGYSGALAFAVHSFFDGLGIGLAFKISPEVGLIVAIAVLAHGFSDGINTVNYILKNKGKSKMALKWLVVDAISPALGVIAAFLFTVSENILGLILSIFCGFFLYVGASDLVPESHHRHPKRLTTIMTILGMLVIFLATRLAGH